MTKFAEDAFSRMEAAEQQEENDGDVATRASIDDGDISNDQTTITNRSSADFQQSGRNSTRAEQPHSTPDKNEPHPSAQDDYTQSEHDVPIRTVRAPSPSASSTAPCFSSSATAMPSPSTATATISTPDVQRDPKKRINTFQAEWRASLPSSNPVFAMAQRKTLLATSRSQTEEFEALQSQSTVSDTDYSVIELRKMVEASMQMLTLYMGMVNDEFERCIAMQNISHSITVAHLVKLIKRVCVYACHLCEVT